MSALARVPAGVPVRRRIAAAHAAARQAQAQVDPTIACSQAVLTARHRLGRFDPDLVEVSAAGHGPEDTCRAA